MKQKIATLALLGTSAFCSVNLLACSADVHDNTLDVHDNTANIDDAKVEFETADDVSALAPGQAVPVTIQAENVYLIDPSETPPPDRVMVAGHFQFYLDDLSTTPILITAEESVNVTIPASAPPGDHKLLCRVHKHDGTPTDATFEMDITVQASASTG